MATGGSLIGLTENEFNEIAMQHTVSPWKYDINNSEQGLKLHDYDDWMKGEGLSKEESRIQCNQNSENCIND